jgi:hypothetical protein
MKPFLIESVASGDDVIDERRSPWSVYRLEKPNVFEPPHIKEKFHDHIQTVVGRSDRCCHARNACHGSR